MPTRTRSSVNAATSPSPASPKVRKPPSAASPSPPPKSKAASLPPAETVDPEALLRRECLQSITSEDHPFENTLIHNPHSVSHYLHYINHKTGTTSTSSQLPLLILHQRAVAAVPWSYKLWKLYLDLLTEGEPIAPAEFVCTVFEAALTILGKMPRTHIQYLNFLCKRVPHRLTKIRQAFNYALQMLPVTQHSRIWDIYLPWALQAGGPVALLVHRRHLLLSNDIPSMENYVGLLASQNKFGLACALLNEITNRPDCKNPFIYYSQLSEMAITHGIPPRIPYTSPTDTSRKGVFDVEKTLRKGIQRFTEQTGRLWTSLARYWITRGKFNRARNVFEEAMEKLERLTDFSKVFDAYIEFEEATVEAILDDNLEGAEDGLERLEGLLDRRPILVNNVMLRQNPNHVMEWLKRTQLLPGVATYEEALKTIHPKRATGRLSRIWVELAKYYEAEGDLERGRETMRKAVQIDYKTVSELADVWCDWAEMELRNKNPKKAQRVLEAATSSEGKIPSVSFKDENQSCQARVFKSLKLWCFRADLEESIATVESTQAIYDEILSLKIATTKTVLSYAAFLEEKQYFEKSFKVMERGIESFQWPVCWEIWNIYLPKVVERYKGTKVERIRDLFETALESCPKHLAKPLYLMYASYEEQYGLLRRCTAILERAARNGVESESDRVEIWKVFTSKVAEFFGVVSSREVFQAALDTLRLPSNLTAFALQWALVEKKLGEIDRARALYGYASQFCDPRRTKSFWEDWHTFEVQYGNEESFKEMLRVKRSIMAKFNTEDSFMMTLAMKAQQGADARDAEVKRVESNPLRRLEQDLDQDRNREVKAAISEGIAFVRESSKAMAQTASPLPPSQSQASNPAEIDMNDVDLSSDGEEHTGEAAARLEERKRKADDELEMKDLKRLSVPASVLGKAAHMRGTEKAVSASEG